VAVMRAVSDWVVLSLASVTLRRARLEVIQMTMQDEKGIFVTIRFWTDFTKQDGTKAVVPKQGWAAGSLYARASQLHGIKSEAPVLFNNLDELMTKLDRLLRQHDISLVIRDDKGNLVPRLGKSYPKWTWTGT